MNRRTIARTLAKGLAILVAASLVLPYLLRALSRGM
jgi:hypothetical protein